YVIKPVFIRILHINMPINFLQKIKLSMSPISKPKEGQGISHRQVKNEHVLGVYIFSCMDLNPNQPLFNDGLPSLIFMPRKSDTVHIKEGGETRKFNSAWICCGVIQSTYWEVPKGLEYIMVIRFKPSSFYSLFNIAPSVFQFSPICNLEDVVSEYWMHVFDEMYHKRTLEERIDFLDSAFFSAITTNEYFPHILTLDLNYIDDKRGNTSVSDVLNYLGTGVNAKWLHRNFVKHLGIPPKRY